MDGNEQSTQNGELDTQPDTQADQIETVETTQIDYSEQLLIISQQQQISIGVSCVLLGVLIVSMIFTILSRYI